MAKPFVSNILKESNISIVRRYPRCKYRDLEEIKASLTLCFYIQSNGSTPIHVCIKDEVSPLWSLRYLFDTVVTRNK